MMKIVSLVVSLVSLAAVACSSSSSGADAPGSSASSHPSDFCSALCSRDAECDNGVDVQTCTSRCKNNLASGLDKVRADVIDATISCYQASDCKSILGGKRVGECVDEAGVSVAPSQAAKDLCDALSSSLDRCDRTIDRAECLSAAKVFADETLASAKSCTEKSCSTIMDCVNAELSLGE